MLQQFANYLIHLVTATVLMGIFSFIYTKLTPIDEFALIRRGVLAAALSFGGALIGFALVLAAAISQYPSYVLVFSWATSAMVVQIATYAVVSRFVPKMSASLENNNVAIGVLMGGISIAVGLVNAASLS